MQIKVKAMCLIVHKGRALVGEHRHPDGDFYRALGGTVEFGETAEAALRREILEEVGSDLEQLTFLKVEENIFEHGGVMRHEVDFLYKGELANKELYEQERIQILDHSDWAVWVPIKQLAQDPRFFPRTFVHYFS